MKNHVETLEDGFSSQQQIMKQEIFVATKNNIEFIQTQKKIIHSFAQPLIQKSKIKSLQPDIALGWKPRILLPNPIPLTFQNIIVDKIVKELLKNQKNSPFKIKYLGPRYQNTFFMHQNRFYNFPYNHIKKPQSVKNLDRQFIGNNKKIQGIKFDSSFQSGNLDCVIKISEFQYDLFLKVDTNTKGHMQWYYFKITEAKAGTKYRFNICNFQKCKSLYSRGMKPYIHSMKKFVNFKIGWQQTGQNLSYTQKILRYDFLSNNYNKYYNLSFQYLFQYDDDQVKFAYCVPYQYSYLLTFIQQLLKKKNINSSYLKMQKLTNSLGGLIVPLLTIHQQQTAKIDLEKPQIYGNLPKVQLKQIKQKKCIIISCRAHPGQSNGSYMMHGFLNFLCSNTPLAEFLRKNIIFKIVPMLNPDGVVAGNYRTGLSGKDFNREFLNPDKNIFPQIRSLKDLVIKQKQIFGNNLILFLDFHGHSVKKNVFMYGPQFAITQKYYYQTKIFPKIISLNSQMFRYYSCIFKVSSFKETTARAIVLKKLNIPFSYTIQASNGSYFDKKQFKDIPFNARLWIQMGNCIGISLFDYCKIVIDNQQLKVRKIRKKRKFGLNHIRKQELQKSRFKRMNQVLPNTKFFEQNSDLNYIQTQNQEVTNQKITKLINQIKQDQKCYENQQKASDDCLSQGSSDHQKQIDDLSPEKIKKLYKFIKIKKTKKLNQYSSTMIQSQVTQVSPPLNLQSQNLSVQKQQSQFPYISFKNKIQNKIKQTFKQRISIKSKPSIALSTIKQPIIKFNSVVKVNNLSFYSPHSSQFRKIIRTQKDKYYRLAGKKKQQQISNHRKFSEIENLNTTYLISKDHDQISYPTANKTFYQSKSKKWEFKKRASKIFEDLQTITK